MALRCDEVHWTFRVGVWWGSQRHWQRAIIRRGSVCLSQRDCDSLILKQRFSALQLLDFAVFTYRHLRPFRIIILWPRDE